MARQVFETGQPAVGNLLQGRVTGRTVAPIYVPVISDGQVVYAIGIAVEADRLSRMLAGQTFGEAAMRRSWTGKGRSWPAPRSLTGSSANGPRTG